MNKHPRPARNNAPHVAHAEEARDEGLGVEGVQVVKVLARAYIYEGVGGFVCV